jgi:hypothetical protein
MQDNTGDNTADNTPDNRADNIEVKELEGGYKLIHYKKLYIYIIENIIEDELCSKIINLINKLRLMKTIINNHSNVRCYHNNLDDLLKLDDALIYEFSTDPIIFDKLLTNLKRGEINYYNDINGIQKKELLEYKKIFDDKTKIIKDIMQDINHKLKFDYNCGYTLRKIYNNTNIHIDNLTKGNEFNTNDNTNDNTKHKNNESLIMRNVSAIFSLNDNYDGGEFIFPEFDLSIKLKKGSVIMFPPYWTHLHGTKPLLNDTYRYTVNTWYGFQVT